ncbi:hypothetical protein ACFE04_012628 [Oxalis oulophora]
MSQGQPKRPQTEQQGITYGDVFHVSGELASKPIAPRDAVAMQSAENQVLGQTQRGSPASIMQSSATQNLKHGVVQKVQSTDVVQKEGVTVAEAFVDGSRLIVETAGGQILGQFAGPMVPEKTLRAISSDAVSIGEALEATALSAGEKPVDRSDAAAIMAAEKRVTGRNEVAPGGVASAAQTAAVRNERIAKEEDKTTLSDVLADAATSLPEDKPVTREDAERVVAAEQRNNPDMITTPGGVAESIASAARLNRKII